MKKESLFMIASLVIGLIILSQCQVGDKPLFYQDNGNFVVDDNFIVKTTVPMSSEDIQQLISLDTAFASLTQGTCYLLNYVRNMRILRTGQITQLDRISQLDKISRLTRYNEIQKILDIHKGCFEVQQIDWAQFGDLKKQLDGILEKYKPASLDGNISIVNNEIATSVVDMKATDIASLNKLTVLGVDEVNICGDYMGRRAFTRWLTRVQRVGIDEKLQASVNKVLTQYK